ncbi:M28 family metallopeptidase [Mucilaginibacter sp. UR6-11]|uniref:M28 family metallopeptidase n=1 Tax=Mucilaginibacter sp. UR6-11 TaxID=1435644 RepID=UPI001E5A7DBA|nr:M28 family metallopeptidase [Mucilaginibacter sp. UR6-11]MCC8424952.1 M28 family metallopeptidase [Mucilaginibacter sp. UR6-11]
MIRFTQRLLLAVTAITAVSCSQNKTVDEQDGLSAFNKDSLINHIKVLSSDEYKGRRPFTEGEVKTIAYLEKTYKGLGLEPGNGSSYLQDVPMVEITPKSVSPLKVQSAKGSFELKNMDDFVMWTERTDTLQTLNNDDVVFAGFGVVAPEYNWNDYAGLDVKGKVVMVMVNDPGFETGDTTLFKGKTMTYYGRWTYKFEEAARQGAKGCIIVHNTAAASYPFHVVQNSNGGVKLYLDKRASHTYQLAMQGWVTHESAVKILQAGGKDTSVLHTANQHGFKGFNTGVKLTETLKAKAVFNKSHNVVAKITGTKRPDEYIIYTAHWDHLGVGKPDAKGDTIYNGALDNASGTAAILEIARAFKSLKTPPERTVIFLSVTAEEQGLLGSEYYGENPIYPLNKTVANINIDGFNNIGKTRDVTISGSGQSQLEDYLKDQLKKDGRYLAPEAHPEAGHYFRSDHFSFAKVGVPSITIGGGIDNVEKGKEYGKKKQEEYIAVRYHQPADQFDSTWNLDGGLEDIELIFKIGKRLAFETSFPQWNAGSEFKKLRK